MNGTRNLTQQNVQNPSHFVNGEMVETRTTTVAQRIISPIQPNFTTPKLKNPSLQQTIIQSTAKPSVAQKYSHIDYQTFLPVTKPTHKQQTLHRNNFAEHNHNYVNGPKTTKAETNTQIFAQSQNIAQPTSNTVHFYDQPRSSQEQNGNYPFFQQNKNNTKNYNTKNQPHHYAQIIFHQMMKNTKNKVINDFTPTKDLVLIVLSNQIFSNHTHEMNKHDNLEITQHHTTKTFNNKIQSTHNHTNQLKCKLKSHFHILYNNTK